MTLRVFLNMLQLMILACSEGDVCCLILLHVLILFASTFLFAGVMPWLLVLDALSCLLCLFCCAYALSCASSFPSLHGVFVLTFVVVVSLLHARCESILSSCVSLGDSLFRVKNRLYPRSGATAFLNIMATETHDFSFFFIHVCPTHSPCSVT